MSHCGGCNMTPDLFKNFAQTLKIQTPKIQTPKIQLTQNTSLKPKQALESKSIQVLTGESQFTNNGKFLKFTRK